MAIKSHVIKNVRILYPNLLRKKMNEMSGKEEYSATLLIDKSDTETLNEIKQILKDLIQEEWKGETPEDLHKPIKDASKGKRTKDDPVYENKYIIRAKNQNNKPDCVDGMNGMKAVIDESTIYSGCYGWVDVAFATYDKNSKQGITVILNNVMKTADGDRVGGGRSAKNAFADYNAVSKADFDSEDSADDLLD